MQQNKSSVEDYDGPVVVNYTCVQKRFTTGILTNELERYLLEQNRMDKSLVSWKITGNRQFEMVFDQAKLISVEDYSLMSEKIDWEQLVGSIQVAPWQIFYFYGVNGSVNIAPGETFSTCRLAGEYDLLRIGDPVEVMDILEMQLLGTATVQSVRQMRLGDLKATDMPGKNLRGHRNISVKQAQRTLSEIYETPISEDEIVTVVTVKATSTLGRSADETPAPRVVRWLKSLLS